MTQPIHFHPDDWLRTELVVFDMDGTLYRQRPLRIRMALELLRVTVKRRSICYMAVLKTYRNLREEMGEREVEQFEPVLIEKTASSTGYPPSVVEAVVTEWMDRKPLRHIAKCRYPKVAELFEGLRRCKKTIAILSDYPATAKLTALGLSADYVVSATDPDIGRLKPHPNGLKHLMSLARAEHGSTLLIGDRPDRDGAVARRAGVPALIRSSKPIAGWQTFGRFDDPIFAPVLQG